MFEKIVSLPLLFSISILTSLTAGSPYHTLPRKYNPPESVPHSSWMFTVDIPKFQTKWKTETPSWMIRGIQKELAPFYHKKITQDSIAKTFEILTPPDAPKRYVAARFRIIDNRVYRMGWEGPFGYDRFFRTLGRLCDYPGVPDLPNIDFILSQLDGIPMKYDPPDFWITQNFEDQAPVMSFARSKEAPYILCIPDVFTLNEWHILSKEIYSSSSNINWEEKKKKAFWRGQPSDFHRALQPVEIVRDYPNQPRHIICDLSKRYPDLIDAGFNAPGAAPTYLWNSLDHLTKTGVNPVGHLEFAYLPVLDGAMCTWPGYLWRLLSNSVAFKHPGGIQWFYEGLQPYVHYIPIDYRLENLPEQIEWAQSHDEKCSEIIKAANEFVLNYVMMEDLYFYQLLLFLEYAKCQDFDTRAFRREVEKDSRWVRIR